MPLFVGGIFTCYFVSVMVLFIKHGTIWYIDIFVCAFAVGIPIQSCVRSSVDRAADSGSACRGFESSRTRAAICFANRRSQIIFR